MLSPSRHEETPRLWVDDFLSFGGSKLSKDNSRPKRTFSLLVNVDKKNSIRLVDKPAEEKKKTPQGMNTDTTKGYFGDYYVDSISHSTLSQAPTAVNSPDNTSALTPRGDVMDDFMASGARTSESQPPDAAVWSDLELDTAGFLPTVVPLWSVNPQKPSFVTTIKARIKRKGKGFIIRLFRQTKPGHEEVAEIFMEKWRKSIEPPNTDNFYPDSSIRYPPVADTNATGIQEPYELHGEPELRHELPTSSPRYSNNEPIPSPVSALSPTQESVILSRSSSTQIAAQATALLSNEELQFLNQGDRITSGVPEPTRPEENTEIHSPALSNKFSREQLIQGPDPPSTLTRNFSFADSEHSSMLGKDTEKGENVQLSQPAAIDQSGHLTSGQVQNKNMRKARKGRRPKDLETTTRETREVGSSKPQTAEWPSSPKGKSWSPVSPAAKELPFIIPADIYRRVEMEGQSTKPRYVSTNPVTSEPIEAESSAKLMAEKETFPNVPRTGSQHSIHDKPAVQVSQGEISTQGSTTHSIKEHAKAKSADDEDLTVPLRLTQLLKTMLDNQAAVNNVGRLGSTSDPKPDASKVLPSDKSTKPAEPLLRLRTGASNRSRSSSSKSRKSTSMSERHPSRPHSPILMPTRIPTNSEHGGVIGQDSSDHRFHTGSKFEKQWQGFEDQDTETTLVKDVTSFSPRERFMKSQISVFARQAVSSILQLTMRGLELVMEAHARSSAVPQDHIRIRWTCKCGEKLFDDFIEKSPGAARRLEQHLNRPRQHSPGAGSGSSSTSGPSSQSSQSSLRAQSTAATSVDLGDISSARAYNNRNSNSSQVLWTPSPGVGASPMNLGNAPYYPPLWLLSCAERQKFTTKLVHLDVDPQKIRSDKELALLVKEEYTKLRPSWQRFLRLRGLCTIQFVQFELHRTQVVDIRKCPDLPAKSDIDYTFLPSDLVPPVGERYLMHLFHHPEDYEDELITYKRVPKKVGMKLRVGDNADIGVGWGIHLVEGFLGYKVWSFFTSFFVIISMIFGIVWAVRKGDIQGAFGVAAYVCALSTLVIGCFIAYLE